MDKKIPTDPLQLQIRDFPLGAPTLLGEGVPTSDAAAFCEKCMQKWKNWVPRIAWSEGPQKKYNPGSNFDLNFVFRKKYS